jgi:hypothetical protein
MEPVIFDKYYSIYYKKRKHMNEKNKPPRNSKSKKNTTVKAQSLEPVKKVDMIKKLEAKVADKKNKNKESSSSTIIDKVLLGVIVAQILVLIYMLLHI